MAAAEIIPISVSQSAAYLNDEDTYAADHAIDKDLASSAAALTQDGGSWLRLQLDKTYTVFSVTIYYRFYEDWFFNTWCAKNETQFKQCVDRDNNIQVSVYQGVHVRASCGTVGLTYALQQSDQIYTLSCGVAGDAVVLSKSSDRLTVFEVVVAGTGTIISLSNYRIS